MHRKVCRGNREENASFQSRETFHVERFALVLFPDLAYCYSNDSNPVIMGGLSGAAYSAINAFYHKVSPRAFSSTCSMPGLSKQEISQSPLASVLAEAEAFQSDELFGVEIGL